MSLALVYQEAFKTIVRIRSGRLRGQTASKIQSTLLGLFGAIQDSAKHTKIPYTLERLEDAEFALAAFADETALSRHDLSEHWTTGKGSLAQQLFNQPNAGNEFYSRLERLRRSSLSEVGEVLEIYCLCLLLGFGGAKKDTERQSLTADLVQQVELFRGKPLRLNSGAQYLSQKVTLAHDSRISALRRSLTVIAAMVVIAYVFYFVDLDVLRWNRISRLAASSGVISK